MSTVITVETIKDVKKSIQSGGFILIDAAAPAWCMPCLKLQPIYEKLADEFAGKVTFIEVDIDEIEGFTDDYDISSVPTLILFNNGKEIDRMSGFVPKKELKEWLENAMTKSVEVKSKKTKNGDK